MKWKLGLLKYVSLVSKIVSNFQQIFICRQIFGNDDHEDFKGELVLEDLRMIEDRYVLLKKL